MKSHRRAFLRQLSQTVAMLPAVRALAAGRGWAETAPGQARIRIHLDRATHTIDRNIYGHFAEHLGRCIYGGVFQEGSPLSDGNGFRTDVLQALKELHIPTIRWPGGLFATYYHWQDGVGPRETRPRKLNVPWKQTETNHFGTAEFIAYCRQVGAEPQIVINCVNGTLEEALGWLEYCNLNTDTQYANLRRRHGREQPYGVKYWELDNEAWILYPPNEAGARAYADCVYKFAAAMKHIDPTIRLTACGLGQPEWDRPVLERLASLIDYLAIHRYFGETPERYRDVLGTARTLEHMIRETRDVIEAVRVERNIPREIGIAFNEYNIVRDWSTGWATDDHRFELSFNLRDAIWLATVLNVFQRNADIVKFANYSELVNVVAPIRTSDSGMFRQTAYHTLQLYSRHCRERLLDVEVEAEAFATQIEPPGMGNPSVPETSEPMPYLDVSATSSDAGFSLVVSNLHEQRAMNTRLQLIGLAKRTTAEVWEVNGPGMDSENSFDEPNAVTLQRKANLSLEASAEYTFPAHSITLIKAANEP